jgi:hypothetical protein
MLHNLRNLVVGGLIFGAASLFAAQAAATQQTPTINVNPPVVQPGGSVTVYGNVGACQTGDKVALLALGQPLD